MLHMSLSSVMIQKTLKYSVVTRVITTAIWTISHQADQGIGGIED